MYCHHSFFNRAHTRTRPQILVLSFTNAAACSIQGRADALLVKSGLTTPASVEEEEEEEEGGGQGEEDAAYGVDTNNENGESSLLTAGTFHGLAASIIRAHVQLALGRPYLRVAGRVQQLQAMRRVRVCVAVCVWGVLVERRG